MNKHVGLLFACMALLASSLMLSACGSDRRATEVRLTGSIVTYGVSPTGVPLRGVLYLPSGSGPFPALLYAHGSAPGSWSNEAFEAIAPAFTKRGWAVFAPYRRGQGLSRTAGPFIRDEIAAARDAGGADQAQAKLVRLLATEHMDDQAQAFRWLSHQPRIARRRIAMMGNSFGGIIALLAAERLSICAAVNAGGGAQSWDSAPALRDLMIGAASRAKAPVFLMQAENDFDVSPSRTLAAAMRDAAKPVVLRFYPPFGDTARDGHAFAYKGTEIWGRDIHAFLDQTCS